MTRTMGWTSGSWRAGWLTLTIAAIGLAMMAHVAGAVPPTQDEPGGASVRVIHGMSDLSAIDLFVDRSIAVSGLTFPSASARIRLAPGDREFQLVPSGLGPDQAVTTLRLAFAAGRDYELTLFGTVVDPRIELISADFGPLDPGRARLRVVNGSLDAGPLDPAFIAGDLLFPTVDVLSASDYADLEAGIYDLALRVAGSDVLFLDLSGTVLVAGTVTDIVIAGQIADSTIQILFVTTPVEIIQLIGRPAHIRAGGCGDRLTDDVVAQLADLLSPRGGSLGDPAAAATENSFTTTPIPFDELVAANHAIVVTRGPDQPEIIVCGEIGGTLTDAGALVVGLREQNASGFVGIAVLATTVGDPTTTDISLFLAPDLAPRATAPSPPPPSPTPTD